MRAVARLLLATTAVYPITLAAAALAVGLDWTIANRLPLLAASLGVGAAFAVQRAAFRRLR